MFKNALVFSFTSFIRIKVTTYSFSWMNVSTSTRNQTHLNVGGVVKRLYTFWMIGIITAFMINYKITGWNHWQFARKLSQPSESRNMKSLLNRRWRTRWWYNVEHTNEKILNLFIGWLYTYEDWSFFILLTQFPKFRFNTWCIKSHYTNSFGYDFIRRYFCKKRSIFYEY